MRFQIYVFIVLVLCCILSEGRVTFRQAGSIGGRKIYIKVSSSHRRLLDPIAMATFGAVTGISNTAAMDGRGYYDAKQAVKTGRKIHKDETGLANKHHNQEHAQVVKENKKAVAEAELKKKRAIED